jgi:copper chaperone CopZ
MKRLLFPLFLFIAGAVQAQIKPVQTAKIPTPTVQCDMCKKKIETYLNRYDGVMTATVNVKRKETTVKYISDRINIEEIKAAVSTAGYDAGDVPALEDAYKKLPLCCKKPEDGGGMKKN